jgi:hypothetical protein
LTSYGSCVSTQRIAASASNPFIQRAILFDPKSSFPLASFEALPSCLGPHPKHQDLRRSVRAAESPSRKLRNRRSPQPRRGPELRQRAYSYRKFSYSPFRKEPNRCRLSGDPTVASRAGIITTHDIAQVRPYRLQMPLPVSAPHDPHPARVVIFRLGSRVQIEEVQFRDF